MGIFDRLSTMLRSNINDLISRAENPEKMLNQLIIDMKSNLAKAKQEVASAIADEKKLQADAETMRKQAEDWERRAMLAGFGLFTISFLGYAFATSGWMMYFWIVPFSLGTIASIATR